MSNLSVRLLAAGCLVFALQGVAKPPPTAVQLPAIALEAADAGVIPLAYVLARTGILTGIVTTHNPSDFTFARRIKGYDATPAVALSDVLARFGRAHANYRIDTRDGVIGLIERDIACAAATVSTKVGPMTFSGDVSKVPVFLTSLARELPGTPRGMTGSMLGDTLDLAQQLPSVSYALEQAVSMERALDKVIALTKGVWIVWQRPRPDGGVGCRSVNYWSNGLVSAPEEDFYVGGTALFGV